MATSKSKLKLGMGGSSSGKSRTEHTELLKAESKKLRRKEVQEVVKNELEIKTILL
jgi:hypothetical protein